MSHRERVLEQLDKVESLPPTAVEAIQILQDPSAEMTEVVRVLEFDPGLTADVLRYANSAKVGGDRSVESVQQAIVRLGFNQVLRLVLAASVGPVARRGVDTFDLDPGAIWEHSALTGLLGEAIQKQLKLPIDRAVFTAGLLHDIGRIALAGIDQELADRITQNAFDRSQSFEAAEFEVLGIDHAEAGAVLLDRWGLPERIVQVVRWHHTPGQAPEPEPLLDIVHVADHLATTTGLGLGRDGLNYRVCQGTVDRLGLSPEGAERVLCRAMDEYERLKELFGAPAPA